MSSTGYFRVALRARSISRCRSRTDTERNRDGRRVSPEAAWPLSGRAGGWCPRGSPLFSPASQNPCNVVKALRSPIGPLVHQALVRDRVIAVQTGDLRVKRRQAQRDGAQLYRLCGLPARAYGASAPE
jgi:hypothetical protein